MNTVFHYTCFNLFLLFLPATSFSQYNQVSLFPKDSSFQLINKLVQVYKPGVILDYNQARVKLYKEIYNQEDSVSCIYTNHSLYLDPNYPDPIGYLIKNGNPNGINCEHSFPQSKGADAGNAKSDMHHLFPARAEVNEARSNFPFSEIEDSRTSQWFYKSFSIPNKPSQFIDEYSEFTNGFFEPREAVKGNIARAIFYFFTMYELQADRLFFENMKTTLCLWHVQDPVDSMEWHRTNQIGNYQEQKANPFVLDCSLAKRTYCHISNTCQLITQAYTIPSNQIRFFPNPMTQELILQIDEHQKDIEITLIDAVGIPVYREFIQNLNPQIVLQLSHLSSGYYQIIIRKNQMIIYRKSILKL